MRSTSADSPEALLRSAGLRVTLPRLTVLEVLDAAPHSDVDTLLVTARTRLGSLSRQAVYDIVATLVDAGLARRIEPAGSAARYETRAGDNHHHLICRDCSQVADVDCAVGAAPCLKPSSTAGFLIDEAEVVHWGRCPACQERDGFPRDLLAD